jgi:hypothetical protein
MTSDNVPARSTVRKLLPEQGARHHPIDIHRMEERRMVPSLAGYYNSIVVTQWPTGLIAKVPLLLALYLVQTGNIHPGRRLVVGVLAAHFALAAFLSLGVGGATWVVCLVSLAMLVVCGVMLAGAPPAITVLPVNPAPRYAALLALVLAFVYPFWDFLTPWARPVFSPMGALPHQSLLVAAVLAVVSAASLPRYFAATTAVAAVVLGLMDFYVAGRASGWLLVAGGAAAGASLLRGVDPRALVLADDPAPTGEEKPATEAPAKPREGRRWDL